MARLLLADHAFQRGRRVAVKFIGAAAGKELVEDDTE
jgi:hypothetical protein